jgi:hypothetical protein
MCDARSKCNATCHLSYINTHRAMTMSTSTIYILRDAAHRIMYCGSTGSPLQDRFNSHKGSQLHDPLACPLYRHVREHGGWDGWTIESMSTTQYDPALTPDLPKYMETMAIKTLKRLGQCPLNHNNAIDLDRRKRAASKAWRDAHPNYMAQKSREHRARRRAALQQEITAAEGQTA